MEPETTSVLFVCTGNVCRSAYAELVGRHLYPQFALRVSSAGVGAVVGSDVDDDMARVLDERGVDRAGFAARQLTRALVQGSDLVLTMSRRQREAVVRESPEAVWRVFVLGQFIRIAATLPPELAGAELVEALRAAHLPPLPEDDVPDPRGKGRSAAVATADRLDIEVRTALLRLMLAG